MSTLARILVSAALAFASLPVAAPAKAAGSADAKASESVEARFRLALEHYRAGRFNEAVTILLELRRRDTDPILVYNLARAYEGLGDDERALGAYEAYLREVPNPEDRGAIERRIDTLRQAIQERARLRAESARSAPARARPSPWPWVVLGTGGALLAVGATFGVLAKQGEADAEREPKQARAAEIVDRSESQALIANVGLVAGGVVAATGLLWLILSGGKSSTTTLSLAPSGLSFTAKGL